jgi:DNA polymerase III sliding clamp (beta) subunit (PCNA family)
MQEFTIGTVALATIVKRVSKGLVKNKFLPYSGYIMIKGTEEELSFIVNDGSNVFVHKIIKDYGITEEFNVSVDGERLLQLVSKLQEDKTKIKVDEKLVTLYCGGTYSFQIETELVPYSTFDELMEVEEGATREDIPTMVLPPINKFVTAQAGLSKLVVDTRLMGYLVDDKVINTTNSSKLSCVETEKETDDSFYLTTRMVDLYGTFTDEEANIYCNNGINIIKTPTKLIYGPVQPGHDTFPAIAGVLATEFEHTLVINQNDLLSALERLQVFNEITVYFNVKDGEITLSLNPKKKTFEPIGTTDDTELEYSKQFDAGDLKELVGKHQEDITVHFGSDDLEAIKLTSDGLTQLLASMED